ncbi:hypothetical protein IWX91DRAFT_185630 [Phyllosticta citricarpa]
MRLACPIAQGLCNCHRHFPSTFGQHPTHRRNECQSKSRMAKNHKICTRACENATVPRVPLRLPHTPSILDTPHYTASTHEYPHQLAGTYYVPHLSTNTKYPYTTSRNWTKHRFSMHKPSVGERKAVSQRRILSNQTSNQHSLLLHHHSNLLWSPLHPLLTPFGILPRTSHHRAPRARLAIQAAAAAGLGSSAGSLMPCLSSRLCSSKNLGVEYFASFLQFGDEAPFPAKGFAVSRAFHVPMSSARLPDM